MNLRGVRSAGVIAGAGVSAESGVPTYRGPGGIYDDDTVEALSGETFARDPERTWRAIAQISEASRGAEPNAGHRALAEMERRLDRFVLLTQNVDGLHRRAGVKNFIEIHGHVFDLVCPACGERGTLADFSSVPRCACGTVQRPDVVLFGEMLPPAAVERVNEEFYRRTPDLVIIAGTSALFPYIVEPVLFARAQGKITVEINPEPTTVSPWVDHALRGPAGRWLPEIAAALVDQL